MDSISVPSKVWVFFIFLLYMLFLEQFHRIYLTYKLKKRVKHKLSDFNEIADYSSGDNFEAIYLNLEKDLKAQIDFVYTLEFIGSSSDRKFLYKRVNHKAVVLEDIDSQNFKYLVKSKQNRNISIKRRGREITLRYYASCNDNEMAIRVIVVFMEIESIYSQFSSGWKNSK